MKTPTALSVHRPKRIGQLLRVGLFGSLLWAQGCANGTTTSAESASPEDVAPVAEQPSTPLGVPAGGAAENHPATPHTAPHTVTTDKTAAEAPNTLARNLFVRAEQALRSSDQVAYRNLRPFLDGYPLAPVLDARVLQRQGTDIAAIDAFLQQHASLPEAPALLRAAIAERHESGDWSGVTRLEALAGQVPGAVGVASTTDCLIRDAALHQNHTERGFAGIEEVWLTGRSLPDACDSVLDAWRGAGGLTSRLAFGRFERALATGHPGLARYLQRYMDDNDRRISDRWLEVQGNAARLADTPLRGSTPETSAFLAARAVALARADIDRAMDILPKTLNRLELQREDRDRVLQEIGIRLAVRYDPRAAGFIDALDGDFDDQLHQWRLRVALHDGNWADVLNASERMSDTGQDVANWRYWRARALEALGRDDEARRQYRLAAGSRDFHGILAAERIGQAPALAPVSVVVDRDAEQRVNQAPAIARMREYLAMDRYADARREWTAIVDHWDHDEQIAASRLFHRWGWHDRAIFTLARAQAWDDLELRFPLAFAEEIVSGSHKHGVDPSWAFAIARQESAFLHDVRSSAGALGIMQVLPSTARQIAAAAGVTITGDRSILDPEINTRLGTYYLRRNQDRFGGHLMLASAAYNAGAGRVASWLPDGSRAVTRGPADADIWAELIPFGETREYIRRVFSYKVIYAAQLGEPTPSLAALLAPVTREPDLGESMQRNRARFGTAGFTQEALSRR